MDNNRYYQVEDGWIELVSGTQFYFGEPTDSMIRVEDIAYALSRLCRYNGHTKRHYSVAEHAIVLADYVESRGGSPRDCLTALHHDDAEYIIGDMARPIKVKMPQFKELEQVIDAAIAGRFGTIYPLPPWLKELDTRIIRDERGTVTNSSDNDWGTDVLEPLGVKFHPILGRFSLPMRRAFLRRHYRWARDMAEDPLAGIGDYDGFFPGS